MSIAVAFAFATNVTIAAILPGAKVGVDTFDTDGTTILTDASPVQVVLVRAEPDSDTTSTATGGTNAEASQGGPLAITIALNSTVGVSAGTIDATEVDGEVSVEAESYDLASASATAAAAGTTPTGAAAKSQIGGYVDLLKAWRRRSTSSRPGRRPCFRARSLRCQRTSACRRSLPSRLRRRRGQTALRPSWSSLRRPA